MRQQEPAGDEPIQLYCITKEDRTLLDQFHRYGALIGLGLRLLAVLAIAVLVFYAFLWWLMFS